MAAKALVTRPADGADAARSSCEGAAATFILLKSQPICGPRLHGPWERDARGAREGRRRPRGKPTARGGRGNARGAPGSRRAPRRRPVVTRGSRVLRVAWTRLLTSTVRYVLKDVAVSAQPQVSENAREVSVMGAEQSPPLGLQRPPRRVGL